jgi:hypothetical protein
MTLSPAESENLVCLRMADARQALDDASACGHWVTRCGPPTKRGTAVRRCPTNLCLTMRFGNNVTSIFAADNIVHEEHLLVSQET